MRRLSEIPAPGLGNPNSPAPKTPAAPKAPATPSNMDVGKQHIQKLLAIIEALGKTSLEGIPPALQQEIRAAEAFIKKDTSSYGENMAWFENSAFGKAIKWLAGRDQD